MKEIHTKHIERKLHTKTKNLESSKREMTYDVQGVFSKIN